jgi:hypothetical protein
VTSPLVHRTVTWVTPAGRWRWNCQDCPAKASGYRTEDKALRIAAIHEDPSRTQHNQGSQAAATKN